MPTTKKVLIISGKRKRALAKATIRSGKGRIRINNVPLKIFQPEVARNKILEPVIQAGEEIISKVDVAIQVSGGGYMGQAEASRIALARALFKWTKNVHLRRNLLDYDRSLLAGDSRQKESKKFGGPGARAKDQKSYR